MEILLLKMVVLFVLMTAVVSNVRTQQRPYQERTGVVLRGREMS